MRQIVSSLELVRTGRPLSLLPALCDCSRMYNGFQVAWAESCYQLQYPKQQDCLDEMQVSYKEYAAKREKNKSL